MTFARRFTTSIIALAGILLIASTASARLNLTVDASTSDGSPLTAVTPGASIILDLAARTTDRAIGITASVSDYDNSVIGFNVSASAISQHIFAGLATGPGTGFGGLNNERGRALAFIEEESMGVNYVQFAAGVNPTSAGGDGSLDIGRITGVVGDPQFRIVFDAIGAPGSSTVVNIGSAFTDYIGTEDTLITGGSVVITIIPEPSAGVFMGLGLAAMAAGRRRE